MKVVETAGAFWWLIFCLLFFCSCSPLQPVKKPQTTSPGIQKEQPAPVSEAEYFLHIIRWPGENFTKISLWYTGTEDNWSRIQEINSSIDPKRIDIGDYILIPEKLLITRRPIPEDFEVKLQKRTKPSSESLPEVSRSTGDIQLFGPLDIETRNEEPPDPIGIERQTEDLFGPVDIETQEEELFGPVDIETQEEELFGPVDIETQIEDLSRHDKEALSMPLEAIE